MLAVDAKGGAVVEDGDGGVFAGRQVALVARIDAGDAVASLVNAAVKCVPCVAVVKLGGGFVAGGEAVEQFLTLEECENLSRCGNGTQMPNYSYKAVA